MKKIIGHIDFLLTARLGANPCKIFHTKGLK